MGFSLANVCRGSSLHQWKVLYQKHRAGKGFYLTDHILAEFLRPCCLKEKMSFIRKFTKSLENTG